MKLIYTHENKLLVESARNYLSVNNIESILRNEFSSGGIGDLAPTEAWPELWVVKDEDIAKARELILVLAKDSDKKEWTCKTCGEINEGSFEICWSCQREDTLDIP